MPDTTLLTLDEAARSLGVRPATLARWLRAGAFPGYRTPGGRYQIAAADVAARLHLVPARQRGEHNARCPEVQP